ncbi:zona pellucida sperm-binding protein 3-like [Pseudorasbora parva]|uniref:zona pellucida sperm-binding protein 3-like n=1 Tax=Pseudorasbora parva TaxID=51549 RepID=UPI00351F6AD9
MFSGLFLMFVATAMAQKDLSVDCGDDEWVSVRWRPELDFSAAVEPSRALLGSCPPSYLASEEMLFFRVSLRDCGFIKQVTAGRVTFSNTLIYDPRPELSFISQPVQCIYDLSVVKADPDETGGQETFSMEIMNPDFSGPAPSLRFRLGSSIPIRAAVEPRSHRAPLRIYLDRCEFATEANISHAAQVYPIITNAGCLMGSKAGNASFLPRRRPDEIRLYLEALRFAVGEKVFLHCVLEACAGQSRTVDRKACQYVPEHHRWVLLDDPSQSYACTCCDSSCLRTADIQAMDGVSVHKVLGPFVMVENDQSDASADSGSNAGPSETPVGLLVFAVALVLMVLMVVLAVSYYLCFWRGGRLGYRPSRDLLTKY